MMDEAGVSSLTRLAEVAGLSQTTVTRTVHRDHTPGDSTITALAKALRVPAKEIYKLTHGQEIQSRPWEPPAEVHRLSKRSQDAVTEIIRAMAAEQAQGEEVMGNAEHPAPMNQAAGSAATRKSRFHVSGKVLRLNAGGMIVMVPTWRVQVGASVEHDGTRYVHRYARSVEQAHQYALDLDEIESEYVQRQVEAHVNQRLASLSNEDEGPWHPRRIAQDYGLAADDSLHQGDHGQIGPDDIEHST